MLQKLVSPLWPGVATAEVGEGGEGRGQVGGCCLISLRIRWDFNFRGVLHHVLDSVSC